MSEVPSTPRPRVPWWQSGVVYHIYPRSFQDTNGDGTGDLPGVIQRLDYFVDLGIDAIWLSPFFPSPMADFGYDVSNYRDVDPVFGTLDDAVRLIHEAHERDIRVIIDFVPNHTSDQHPWFQESQSSRDNPKRDWYVWRDPGEDGGPPNNWDAVFGGSAWERDETTGQFYLHSFLVEQPDLNWRNPEVQQAMMNVLRFWLNRGVDGFRVDVMWKMIKDAEFRDNPLNPDYDPNQFLSQRFENVYNENQPEVHDIVRLMRQTVDEYDDRLIIGEIYLDFPDLVSYYGPELDECHLPFNFSLILHAWEADTLADLITRYEAELPPGAWPNWVLANHDRPRISSRVGSERLRVAAMLLLTLRGTPTIYYGQEIGMHDVHVPKEAQVDPAGDIIPGMNRDPQRTPMQWEPGPGAGFTSGEPWLPIAGDANEINVSTEHEERTSLLSLYRWLLQFRRSEKAISIGDYERIWCEGDVLAYIRTDGVRRFLIALNFSGEAASLALDGSGDATVVVSTGMTGVGARMREAVELDANAGLVLALPSREG